MCLLAVALMLSWTRSTLLLLLPSKLLLLLRLLLLLVVMMVLWAIPMTLAVMAVAPPLSALLMVLLR